VSVGRTRKPVPGLRSELGITGPAGTDATAPDLSAGPDEWNKNYVEAWTASRNALHAVHRWLRDVLAIGGAHYYKGRVRFVISADEATSASMPVSLVLAGLPTDAEFMLRGPTDLSRPKATAATDATLRRMIPKKAVPSAGEPLPPAPAWKYVGPTQRPDPDTVLAGRGLPTLPPDPGIDTILDALQLRKLSVTEDDLLTRNALVVGLRPGPLTGAHGHALMTLTGGIRSGRGRRTRLSRAIGRLLALGGIRSGRGRRTRPSRAIGRLLTYRGGGVAWLGTVFSPIALKRYAPDMLSPQGYTFPRLVSDIGRLTGTVDATVKLAFYDARAGGWHAAALAGETVHQDENDTGSGTGRALTESAALDPTVVTAGGIITDEVVPTAVLNQYASFGSTGGVKTIRSGAFRRRTSYQLTAAGALIVLEMQASKYAGHLKLPKSVSSKIPLAWGNPVAEYVSGGKARLVYRLDNSASLLLDGETSVRLRVLPAEGIPLPASRIFPLVSPSPQRDVDRVRAAASLAGHGSWHPLFLHYDPVADRVRMTVTEQPAGGGPAVPAERALDVGQVAELIRSIDGSAGHPMVLVTEGAARLGADNTDSFATQLGRLLAVDMIATPDQVLQDDGRTLAASFDVDAEGHPIPGTIRRGNWMLLPADGSGPLLLGDDLDRALEAEVPARLRAPARPHELGVTKPARPVAWTAPAPVTGAVPAIPPAPARRTSLPVATLAGEGERVDLGGGMAATAYRYTNGNYSVLVHSRDGNPADWAHIPPALLDLPGYVTVAVPEPYRRQGRLTRALDTLIGGTAIPPGQGVLLVLPGAAGTGPGSFAHRLQQRYQSRSGTDPAGGLEIIAPGGMVARIGANDEPDAVLHTYHEDDAPAQWWRFPPNADPVALHRFLWPSAQLAPERPARIWRPFKLGDGLHARPIPAGWHLTADLPLTDERFLQLEAIPWLPETRRIVIDAEHYGDGSLLARLLTWLAKHDDTVVLSPPWPGTVVELYSADPAGLRRLRHNQGLPEFTASYLSSEAGRHSAAAGHKIQFWAPEEVAPGMPDRLLASVADTVHSPDTAGLSRPFTVQLRPYTQLEARSAGPIPASSGVPNGTSQHQETGYPIVWQIDDRGLAQWRPFAQYVSHRPWEGEQPRVSPEVTSVLPTSLWLRDGHRLLDDPDLPGKGVFITGPGGPVVEVVASGLWVRPGEDNAGGYTFSDADAAAIRGAPPSARGPVITIGLPGYRVSEQEWELAHHLVAHLLPPDSGLRQRTSQVRTFLHITGNVEPVTSARVSRLASTGNVTWLGSNIVAGQYALADTAPRVTQTGPLPAHHVPGQPPRPARMGAPQQQDGPRALDHGIPHGRVTLGGELAEAFDLGPEVVVNPQPIDSAYVIVRSGRERLALPSEGFFRAGVRNNPPLAGTRLRPGGVMLKVLIPPGAAILPFATRDGGHPQREAEVWLPPGALARVRVTRVYINEAGRRRSSAFRGALASLLAVAAGEPIDAGWLFLSPGHIAAEADYQQALHDLEDQRTAFQAGSANGQDLIAAQADAEAARATRGREAAGTRVAHHIPAQAGETTLVFSADPATGRPALDGRPVAPGEFARSLTSAFSASPGPSAGTTSSSSPTSPAGPSSLPTLPSSSPHPGCWTGPWSPPASRPGSPSPPCHPLAAGTCTPPTPSGRN
jgi:hypothetical protein